MLPEKAMAAAPSRPLWGSSFRGERPGVWSTDWHVVPCRMASTSAPAATPTVRAVSGPALNVALHVQIARDGLARPSTLASALAALEALRQAKAERR